MSNDAKLERRTQPPDQRAAAAAVDDKSCQDNEKYNCSGDRPPVIFAAPWVGPPARRDPPRPSRSRCIIGKASVLSFAEFCPRTRGRRRRCARLSCEQNSYFGCY